MNTYRPVSLLPICGKLFEKIVFDTIFQSFIENNLRNPNQSRFMPADSCIYQPISVTHEIYASFESNPSLEVGVFLDISKTFHRVWHEGLFHTIKRMGAKGDLLTLIESLFIRKTTAGCRRALQMILQCFQLLLTLSILHES